MSHAVSSFCRCLTLPYDIIRQLAAGDVTCGVNDMASARPAEDSILYSHAHTTDHGHGQPRATTFCVHTEDAIQKRHL